MTWRPDICIFHSPCDDGFAAAYAVWRRWGDQVQFVPGVYGRPAPDVTGKRVLIVDFSFKRDVLEDMGSKARSIIVLDHHKTAQADLVNVFPDPAMGGSFATGDSDDWNIGLDLGLPVWARFDMEKSGARLAWEFCHQDEPVPELIKFVEDRDPVAVQIPADTCIQSILAIQSDGLRQMGYHRRDARRR